MEINKKNKIYNISSNLIIVIHQALLFIIIGNFFGSLVMGKFTYFISIAYVFSFIFNYGYQINSLIHLQKKHYRILQKYLTTTLFSLFLCSLVVFIIKINIIYIAALFYVATNVFKDILNNLYVVKEKYKMKLIFNIIDLVMVIIVLLIIGKFQFENDNLLNIIFFSLVIQKILLFYLMEDFKILTPKLKYLNLASLIFTFKSTFYNNINTMFTFFYLQGYYVILGFLGMFELIALVKALSIFQSLAGIMISSLFQYNMKNLIKNVSNLIFLNKFLFKLSFIQVLVLASSFILIVNTDVLYWLFKIQIHDNIYVLFFLASFLFVPSKILYANILTIKYLHKERLNAVIFSTLLSLPFLFATYYNKWYLVIYIILLDLIMIAYFKYYIKKKVEV